MVELTKPLCVDLDDTLIKTDMSLESILILLKINILFLLPIWVGENLLVDVANTYVQSDGRSHRLENPGAVDLILIEVQSSEYLGEDDIVRFEDKYNRVTTCT